MSFRFMALMATLGLSGTACITPYDIQPATGGTVGVSSNSALTMRVNPNAWHSEPVDLESYLTPLAVDLTSQQASDVWISYADFSLVDEWGVRYRVISPFEQRPEPPARPAPPAPVKLPPPPPKVQPLPPAATPPASSPDENDGLDDSWRQYFDRDPLEQRTSRGSTSGQILLVQYQPQNGGLAAGVAESRDPSARRGLGRTYYGPFVDRWDERYYPESPSYDVIRLGLAEGMLKTGERVSGFIYFQNATNNPARLQLTWTAHSPDGRTVASLTIPFTVNDGDGP